MEKTGAITQWQIEGTISAVPAPFFLHPAEEESAHRRPGLPLGLRPPPLLPSQGLYSLAVFFLPPSTSPSLQNYGSGDRNDPPGLAPPFIHCPTFFFFLVPPHNPTSWKVSTPAVFTSLPVVRSAAHSNLASIPPAQLKWLLSPH